MKINWEPTLQRSFIAAGGALVGAGVSIYSGIQQRKAAQKQLAANQFQAPTVPQGTKDNQQLARQWADIGLPAEQYAQAQKNIMRSQVTAMRMASDRRSGNGLIPAIQQRSNDAYANLEGQNQAAQNQNKRLLYGANAAEAGQENRVYDITNQNRSRNYDYGMSLLGAGGSNIVSGIDTGVAGLMRYGSMRNNPYYGSSNSYNGPVKYAQPQLPDVVSNYSQPNVS